MSILLRDEIDIPLIHRPDPEEQGLTPILFVGDKPCMTGIPLSSSRSQSSLGVLTQISKRSIYTPCTMKMNVSNRSGQLYRFGS